MSGAFGTAREQRVMASDDHVLFYSILFCFISTPTIINLQT